MYFWLICLTWRIWVANQNFDLLQDSYCHWLIKRKSWIRCEFFRCEFSSALIKQLFNCVMYFNRLCSPWLDLRSESSACYQDSIGKLFLSPKFQLTFHVYSLWNNEAFQIFVSWISSFFVTLLYKICRSSCLPLSELYPHRLVTFTLREVRSPRVASLRNIGIWSIL